MPRARCKDAPLPEFVAGLEQFNRGQFFECHETLELLWRAEFGPLRELYQGILQVGVGFYHLKRGNHHGALALLERGLRRLAPFGSSCQGVDVARLAAESQRCYEELTVLGPERLAEFDRRTIPQVHFSRP